MALPRECSAQTCELAAMETSNIVDKFLAHTNIPFVNAQFSFCVYVAAKFLLFDHEKSQRPLRPEFQQLLRNLLEISSRWTGKDQPLRDSQAAADQASLYAQHLVSLYDSKRTFDLYDHYACIAPDTLQYASPVSVSTPQYSQPLLPSKSSINHHKRQNSINSYPSISSPRRASTATAAQSSTRPHQAGSVHNQGISDPSISRSPSSFLPHHPSTSSSNYNHPLNSMGAGASAFGPSTYPPQPTPNVPNEAMQDQSLLSLSDTLLDSQFLDMDRVITFEDANFFMPFSNYS